MSMSELIEKEVSAMPEPLQREVYDFARFLRHKNADDAFNGRARETERTSAVEEFLHFDKRPPLRERASHETGGKLLADRSLSRLLKQDWPKTPEDLEELRGLPPTG